MTNRHASPVFIDNQAIKDTQKYKVIPVATMPILKSWKESLFSFEWLSPDGAIKNFDALMEADQKKFKDITAKLESDESLERPILGLGMLDNVEIGSKKEVFLTLASHKIETIEVHIPVALETEMKKFMKDT